MRKKAARLAQQPTVNFYELARVLVKLQDEKAIQDLPAETGMSRRRLYYLLEVGKFIKNPTVGKADAERLGWTKLQIVARYVNQSNATDAEVAEYVKRALATKAYALGQALREGVNVSRRTAMFRLSDDANDELSEALVAFGAEHARRGLSKKEQALLLIVRAAMRSTLRLNIAKQPHRLAKVPTPKA